MVQLRKTAGVYGKNSIMGLATGIIVWITGKNLDQRYDFQFYQFRDL